MDAPGIRGLVNGQLIVVILMRSSTCTRMDAPGMRRLVNQQLGEVIWMCSSTHGRTVARSHKILRKMMITVTNTATMCLSNLLLNKLLLTSTAITTHDHLLVIQFSCF